MIRGGDSPGVRRVVGAILRRAIGGMGPRGLREVFAFPACGVRGVIEIQCGLGRMQRTEGVAHHGKFVGELRAE